MIWLIGAAIALVVLLLLYGAVLVAGLIDRRHQAEAAADYARPFRTPHTRTAPALGLSVPYMTERIHIACTAAGPPWDAVTDTIADSQLVAQIREALGYDSVALYLDSIGRRKVVA